MLLKDCCTFQEGYVNPSKKELKYFKNGTINWIKATDLTNGFIYDTEDKINEYGLNSCSNKTLFPINSIVISKSGTIGNLGILKCEAYGNRATINIMVNDKIANPLYIYYVLLAKNEEIKNRAVGSIQKNLYISALETIELPNSDRPTQDKIVEILSNIDNQIERNNKIAKRLQVLGSTIYSKNIKETSNFFAIDESKIKTGKQDANFATPNGRYKFFTCSEDSFLCDNYEFDGKNILIAGNGNFNVKFYDGKFNAYQRTYVIGDNDIYGNLYYTYSYNTQSLFKGANGSIVKFITIGMLKDIQIPEFSKEINDILNNIVYETNNIKQETDNLNQLKSKLLPLLINGQINI